MSNLYNKINELCKTRGITTTELCRKIGRPKNFLSDLKLNRKTTIAVDALKEISIQLEVSMNEFLEQAETQQYKMVEKWHESYWKDWEDAKTDENKKNAFKIAGCPPELKSIAENLFNTSQKQENQNEKTLLDLFNKLNQEGQIVLINSAKDMVAGGRYDPQNTESSGNKKIV